MTRSALVAALRSAISATLPRPANRAASGAARRAVTTSARLAPAERASAFNSASRSAGSPSPRSTSTSNARSPASGRSSIKCLRRGSGFALGIVRHRDGAGRHHGRDGVLVHHLGHSVLEEDDILVERFDLSLKLDAVHEVDRNLNMFFAQ